MTAPTSPVARSIAAANIGTGQRAMHVEAYIFSDGAASLRIDTGACSIFCASVTREDVAALADLAQRLVDALAATADPRIDADGLPLCSECPPQGKPLCATCPRLDEVAP